MGKEVSNSEILRAIFELADHVDDIAKEQKEMKQEIQGIKQDIKEVKQDQHEMKQDIQGIKQEIKEIKQEQMNFKQQLTDTETKFNYEIKKVGDKINLISNRILDTEADVQALKDTIN